MQTFRTEDKRVSKYIHTDGSETCIKTVYSVDYKPNPETGEVDVQVTDRNKYSIFISPSQGCAMQCPFCYLTIDEVPHRRLGLTETVANIKDAITAESQNEVAELHKRYMKVCWMGMGEAIFHPNNVYGGTMQTLSWAMENGLAKGLDGVDISTVLPKLKSSNWVSVFGLLNDELQQFPLNPNNKNVVNNEEDNPFWVEYSNRSRFRFFYSLHSAIQESRDIIVPNAMPLQQAIPLLGEVDDMGVNVIFHHMFLDGMNDSEEELIELVEFMKLFPHSELRILRYNSHPNSDIKESEMFKECVCYLQQEDWINIKVQVSYGADVKSACGQFIYNSTAELEDLKVV